jgi:hypothetical protein
MADNEKRQKIIDTAKQLFAEKGYAATGIREIAEQADLSLGNFYNYFKNKEELFTSLIDPENIIRSLSGIPAMMNQGFPGNLGKIILEIKRVVDMNIELYRLIFIDLTEFGGFNTNRILESVIGFGELSFNENIRKDFIGSVIKDLDYRFFTRTFIISMISLFVVNNILPSAKIELDNDEELANRIANVMLNGVLV